MRAVRSVLTAVVVCLAPSAFAQSTVFDINLTFAYDRLPPDPRPGIRNNQRMTVTLSGKNSVQMDNARRAGQFSDSHRFTSSLGGEGRGPAWKVINASTIQATMNYPASTRVVTLTTTGGNSCSVAVADRLKPGAREFKFRRMDGGGMGNFTQPQLVASSCTVR